MENKKKVCIVCTTLSHSLSLSFLFCKFNSNENRYSFSSFVYMCVFSLVSNCCIHAIQPFGRICCGTITKRLDDSFSHHCRLFSFLSLIHFGTRPLIIIIHNPHCVRFFGVFALKIAKCNCYWAKVALHEA